MFFEKESRLKINRKEDQESGVESSKERQIDDLEKKMGARERVEQVTHEVKHTQKQMQNIMLNMQQVVRAVATIRKQLQLDETDANIPSLTHDQKVTESLQKKLFSLKSQLDSLRLVLLKEEKEQLRKENPHLSEKELEHVAQSTVEDILKRLNVNQ